MLKGVKNRDNYKLKELLLNKYEQLSESDKAEVTSFIFNLNGKLEKETIVDSIKTEFEKSEYKSTFIANVYFYLCKILFEMKKKSGESIYDFLNKYDFKLSSSSLNSKEALIELLLAKIAENSTEDLTETYYKCRDIYLKAMIYTILLRIRKSSTNPQEYVIFNQLFMNIRLFLKKDPKMRLINYLIMTLDETNTVYKIRSLLKIMIPFKPEGQEPAGEYERLIWFRVVTYSSILPRIFRYSGDIDKYDNHHDSEWDYRTIFIKFLNFFYINTLYYKSYNKLKKTDERLIRKILKTIINLFEDDDERYNYYGSSSGSSSASSVERNYKKYLNFIRENSMKPDFFYFYVISLIMNTPLMPRILSYYSDFIIYRTLGLQHYQRPLTFPISRATSRDEFADELASGSGARERLTAAERTRLEPRRLYINEFLKRFKNKPKEVQYIFLRMIRGYYFGEVKKGTNIKIIHDYLNGYVYNPISQNI